MKLPPRVSVSGEMDKTETKSASESADGSGRFVFPDAQFVFFPLHSAAVFRFLVKGANRPGHFRTVHGTVRCLIG